MALQVLTTYLLIGLSSAAYLPILPNGCPSDFSIDCLLPHQTDCAKYYACSNGERIEKECPIGTLFHNEILKCLEVAAGGCTSVFNPTTPANLCPEGGFGNIQHPDRCDLYIFCPFGIELFCPSGFEFDPDTASCVVITPGGCTSSLMTTEQTTTILDWTPVVSTSFAPVGLCPEGVSGLVPHPDRCDGYVSCPFGIVVTCFSGLEFDPDTGSCIVIAPGRCTSSLSTMTTEQATTTTSTALDWTTVESTSSVFNPITPVDLCPEGVSGNVPHPDRCDAYIWCHFGIVITCPSGFEFDPDTGFCEEIVPGGCTMGQGSTWTAPTANPTTTTEATSTEYSTIGEPPTPTADITWTPTTADPTTTTEANNSTEHSTIDEPPTPTADITWTPTTADPTTTTEANNSTEHSTIGEPPTPTADITWTPTTADPTTTTEVNRTEHSTIGEPPTPTADITWTPTTADTTTTTEANNSTEHSTIDEPPTPTADITWTPTTADPTTTTEVNRTEHSTIGEPPTPTADITWTPTTADTTTTTEANNSTEHSTIDEPPTPTADITWTPTTADPTTTTEVNRTEHSTIGEPPTPTADITWTPTTADTTTTTEANNSTEHSTIGEPPTPTADITWTPTTADPTTTTEANSTEHSTIGEPPTPTVDITWTPPTADPTTTTEVNRTEHSTIGEPPTPTVDITWTPTTADPTTTTEANSTEHSTIGEPPTPTADITWTPTTADPTTTTEEHYTTSDQTTSTFWPSSWATSTDTPSTEDNWTTDSSSAPGSLCPEGVIGNVPHPDRCDGLVWCPFEIVVFCPSGFEFDPDTEFCEKIVPGGCTMGQGSTTELQPATEQSTPADTTPITPANLCPEGFSGAIPNPARCDGFIWCFQSIGVEMLCVSGAEFDPDLGVCVIIAPGGCTMGQGTTATEHQPTTEQYTTSDQTTHPIWTTSDNPSTEDNWTTDSSSAPGSLCPEGFSGAIPNPARCDGFIWCFQSTGVEMLCVSGAEFDPDLGVCVIIAPGGCTMGQGATSTEHPTSSEQPTPTVATTWTTPTANPTTTTEEHYTTSDHTVWQPSWTTSIDNLSTGGNWILTTDSSSSLCPEGVSGYIPYPGGCDGFVWCPEEYVIFCPSWFEFDPHTGSCVAIGPGGCTVG